MARGKKSRNEGPKENAKSLGGKQKREPTEFDKQHAALLARNTKVKKAPVSITVQGSVLSGVVKKVPLILPDVLLTGEGDTIDYRAAANPRVAPTDNSTGSSGNMYSVLEEEEKCNVTLSVKPSLLSRLVSKDDDDL
jgi:hypothetical protein